MKFYENDTKTVVFDIDGVIACAPGRYGREEEIVKKVTKRFGEDFIKGNSFTVEGYLHFIYPGVFEFIRWLVRRGVKIHFYSTGAKVRNEPLVAMVLERALSGEPDGKLGEITKGMKILSREDIMKQHNANNYCGIYESTVYGGNYHKVLCPYIVDFTALPDTLLIDDDTSYMAHGEELNFIGGKYYGCFYEDLSPETDKNAIEQFLELCRTFLFAGVVSRIFEYVGQTSRATLTDGSEVVQYGNGKDRYYPEDCTYFNNTVHDVTLYEDGLAALRSINPQLEFPLPVPSAFRDDPERFPRHQTDAERFRKRRNIDMFAAECTKKSRLVATEAIRSM